MRIPAFLYGNSQAVAKHCRAKVKALKEGADLDALIDQWVDTKTTKGLLVLAGPSPLLKSDPHFNLYRLAREIVESDWDGAPVLFDQALRDPWLFLCYLGQDMSAFFAKNPETYRPFLTALVHMWFELTAEGSRYSDGTEVGFQLWALPTNIYAMVARTSGLPYETLKQAFDTGKVLPILRKAIGEA
jgi:hypothetical protein